MPFLPGQPGGASFCCCWRCTWRRCTWCGNGQAGRHGRLPGNIADGSIWRRRGAYRIDADRASADNLQGAVTDALSIDLSVSWCQGMITTQWRGGLRPQLIPSSMPAAASASAFADWCQAPLIGASTDGVAADHFNEVRVVDGTPRFQNFTLEAAGELHALAPNASIQN